VRLGDGTGYSINPLQNHKLCNYLGFIYTQFHINVHFKRSFNLL
jgi:hypothetical protein